MFPLFPDLPGVVFAMLIYALVALLPGWALGYWLNLLEFRQRFKTMQLAIAVCTSVAVMPILLILVSRIGGIHAAGAITAWGMGLWGVVTWIHQRRDETRSTSRGDSIRLARRRTIRIVLIVAGVWVVVALGSLMDCQIDHRLYCTVTWIDHTKRVALIDAILRTGVPPDAPNFHPGHAIKAFYYYGWYVWAATVNACVGRSITPLQSLIAGVAWSGLGFIAAAALAMEYLGAIPRRRLRADFITVAVLLLVTGVDILPAGFNLLRYLEGGKFSAPRTTEWWNEQVTGFLDMFLWVPHHVAGLVAGTFAVILLRDRFERPDKKQIGAHVLAACGIASMATQSLYVAMPLAAFLAPYTIYCAIQRRWRRVGALTICGAGAIVLTIPFLLDLLHAPGARSGIVFGVRPFSPVNGFLAGRNFGKAATELVDLLVLPLNYFCEFGFYFIAGIFYWIIHRKDRAEADRFSLGLLIASLLVATLLRSTLAFNDLGWRTIMWAQLVLLIWAIEPARAVWLAVRDTSAKIVDPIADALADRYSKTITALLILAGLGISSTVYDLFLLRFSFAIWQDGEMTSERAYSLRQAYQWIDRNSPRDAVIQHNPGIALDIFNGLYGNRQIVVADEQISATLATNYKQFNPIYFRLAGPFVESTSIASVRKLSEDFDISYFIVKDRDDIWKNRGSWVWAAPARFSDDHARVIAASDLANLSGK